jgi:HlyD family secretion protein
MQKKTMLYGLGAVAVVGLTLAWAFAPRPIEVELASATEARFEATVDEDGKTRLRERYVVSAPLAGQLARIGLLPGDVVEAGAVVATLKPVLAPMTDERTRREQQARVETGEMRVKLAASGIERAQVALRQADNELRRTEQLAGDGFVSPTQLDTARLARQAAQKELDSAGHERRVAEAALEEARAALSAVRAASGPGASARDFDVRAPVAGRVLRVLQASEGTVALGTPLLEIGDVARLEIVAELLTTDALQTPPGTPVRIDRWGGPTSLEGRVRRVEPSAFTKVSALGVEEQRVNVLIDITSAPGQWRSLGDGYRVGLRLVTLASPKALQVPVSAVFPRTDAPGMAAFTVQDGRARLTPVDVGARNGATAWVRSGLAVGAQVIVYPPPAVRDGAHVKARSV